MIRTFASIAFLFVSMFASVTFGQTISGIVTPPPASILPQGQILAPNWPSKGYYYRLEGENMMVVFETETACQHPRIQALPEKAKKGLFQVTMYNYSMTTIRAIGCSGIENGVASIVWFDGNQGKLDLDELFPISKDTQPPAVTPSEHPATPRKQRV